MSTPSSRIRSIAATLAFGLGLAGAAVAQAQTSPVAPDVQRSISTSTPNQTDKAIKGATPATPAAPTAGTAAVPATPAKKASDAAKTTTGKVKTN